MRCVKFPKIEQFRTALKNLKYDGVEKCTFIGSVKLHGTNAGVTLDLKKGGIYAQSRNKVLALESDNAGFAAYVEQNKDMFKIMLNQLAKENRVIDFNGYVTIYGEWAGKGIQSGVAISNIEKSFFLFGAKYTDRASDESIWFDHSRFNYFESNVYQISAYGEYKIDIDLNSDLSIAEAQNTMTQLTLNIENECPVAKKFGITGVGEGLVWRCDLNGKRYMFKTKGGKHSVTKVKTIAPVDVEKLAAVSDFVEYAVTENRFKQGIQETGASEMKDLGNFIRWIFNDVMSEESDVIEKNNLDKKMIGKALAAKSKTWFINNGL